MLDLRHHLRPSPPQAGAAGGRSRALTLAAAALGATLLGAGLAMVMELRSRPTPVSRWRSAAGRAQYLAAYEATLAELPEPDVTLDVPTGFGTVRVYRYAGTGTSRSPLLLLPGTRSGAPVWADNIPHLLRTADVYALDLLGEPGLSVQDRPISSDDDIATWLDQVLAALPEESFHLLGLSVGGRTATALAVRRPAQVASMTLLDPGMTLAPLPPGTIVRSIPASLPWFPRSWRDAFTSHLSGGIEVEDLPVARMIEAGMQHFRMALPQPALIAPELPAQCEPPVLAIIAGNSTIHDPQQAAETARSLIPDVRVHVIPGASHAISGEHPREIAALVDGFVQEVDARCAVG